MKNQVALTTKRVQGLPLPEKGRVRYYDTRCKGLTVVVSSTGRKSYYLYTWDGTKPLELKIGDCQKIALDAARDACREMLGRQAAGDDLAGERRERREEPTLGQLWEAWLAHGLEHKKPRSVESDERLWKRFLKKWKARRLSQVTAQDVAKLKTTIGNENGRYISNRTLALIRAMYNHARRPAVFAWRGDNPATGIPKYAEHARDRWLDGPELKAFFAALDDEPELYADFFKLAFYTGARRNNLQTARWEQIDLRAGFWRIPDTKGGIPVVVPLCRPAREILERRYETCGNGSWVFPTRSRTGHLVEIKTSWNRITKRAGIQNARPHDLRRSAAAWLVRSGANMPTIAKVLGHKQVSTTMKVYAQVAQADMAAAVDAASEAVDRAVLTLDVVSKATKPEESPEGREGGGDDAK